VTTDIINPILFDYSPKESVISDFNTQKILPSYQRLIEKAQISGIWDDHDYNESNGDKNNPTKEWMQKLYLDFLDEPVDSIRRKREGIYTSYTFGSGYKTVKIILLDVRYFNDPDKDDNFGEEQWNFLKKELEQNDSTFTIVASSILVLSPDRMFPESLSPATRKRLLGYIRDFKREGVVFISGDIHTGQMMKAPCPLESIPYQLWELNTSGLTHTLWIENWFLAYFVEAVYPPYWQHSALFHDVNFGSIEFDWSNEKDPSLRMALRTKYSKSVSEVELKLSDLSFNKAPFQPFDQECYCRDSSPSWVFGMNILSNLDDIPKLMVYSVSLILLIIMIMILLLPLILFNCFLQWFYRRRMRQLAEERKKWEEEQKKNLKKFQ